MKQTIASYCCAPSLSIADYFSILISKIKAMSSKDSEKRSFEVRSRKQPLLKGAVYEVTVYTLQKRIWGNLLEGQKNKWIQKGIRAIYGGGPIAD